MEPILALELIVRAVIVSALLQLAFAMMTRWERRAMAQMQWRIGPNRAGPAGIFQPFADGLKLLFKEQLMQTVLIPGSSVYLFGRGSHFLFGHTDAVR